MASSLFVSASNASGSADSLFHLKRRSTPSSVVASRHDVSGDEVVEAAGGVGEAVADGF